MESFKVKPGSWHYKMVRRHCDTWDVNFPKDFCTYWRYAMACYPLMVAIGLFALVFIVAFVGAIGSLLYALWMNPVAVGISIGIVAVLIGVTIGLIVGIDKLAERYVANNPPKMSNPKPKKVKKDGFFKTRYKAWKGQYCPMVEIEYE